MRQYFIPGQGHLFRDEGLPIAELAALSHAAGFLSDEEFEDQGGVPALRRKIYDITCQNREFERIDHQVDRSVDDRGARERRLAAEANAYANERDVNDPRYLEGIVSLDDLDRFNIPATGKNLIDAELLAMVMKVRPSVDPMRSRVPLADLTVSIIKMIRWIRAGRPGAAGRSL